MLQPKKSKFRRTFKGRSKGVSRRGTTVAFGSYGLKAMETKWITARQIESCRIAMIRLIKGKGKIWIRIFPDKPITTKGQEVPMGGGKGSVDHYVFPIRPGRIMFEIEGVSEEIAREAFKRASSKLPIKTKFVKKI